MSVSLALVRTRSVDPSTSNLRTPLVVIASIGPFVEEARATILPPAFSPIDLGYTHAEIVTGEVSFKSVSFVPRFMRSSTPSKLSPCPIFPEHRMWRWQCSPHSHDFLDLKCREWCHQWCPFHQRSSDLRGHWIIPVLQYFSELLLPLTLRWRCRVVLLL